ncbi:MAG: hypothetical protein COA78_02485 [Blastopirellula sp.]|nr:MAG: hypothetical protein COA78_02485 [Blastopirellula sp.]
MCHWLRQCELHRDQINNYWLKSKNVFQGTTKGIDYNLYCSNARYTDRTIALHTGGASGTQHIDLKQFDTSNTNDLT